ncbi:hypothetical protein EDF46_1440 [Frondihabitans sp. PhB188]|uniref:hypothetical protein n=1 Tax=Frondihabitans sp. PhB188 TaxID=2485200 RepID=UPI000FC07160|nr:hypothetical protein [Frondihabitans sp. PhB188]ROQ39806.1 hypothetical protein EDF46_1440 [Frondihabitans sp. PhB188]
MKISRTARLFVLVASAAIAAAGLTSCSSPSTPSAGDSSAPASTPTPTADAKTYTSDDLTALMTAVKPKVGSSAKLYDNAALKAANTSAAGSSPLSTLLDQSGVTIAPESCKTKLKAGLGITAPADSVGAALVDGTSTVSVATVAGKALPSAITSGDTESKVDDLISACGKITLTVQGQSITIALKKGTASTDADRTIDLEETITLPSSAGAAAGDATFSAITAVQGNLLISSTGITKSTISSFPKPAADALTPADAVDAVVAEAAK